MYSHCLTHMRAHTHVTCGYGSGWEKKNMQWLTFKWLWICRQGRHGRYFWCLWPARKASKRPAHQGGNEDVALWRLTRFNPACCENHHSGMPNNSFKDFMSSLLFFFFVSHLLLASKAFKMFFGSCPHAVLKHNSRLILVKIVRAFKPKKPPLMIWFLKSVSNVFMFICPSLCAHNHSETAERTSGLTKTRKSSVEAEIINRSHSPDLYMTSVNNLWPLVQTVPPVAPEHFSRKTKSGKLYLHIWKHILHIRRIRFILINTLITVEGWA